MPSVNTPYWNLNIVLLKDNLYWDAPVTIICSHIVAELAIFN